MVDFYFDNMIGMDNSGCNVIGVSFNIFGIFIVVMMLDCIVYIFEGWVGDKLGCFVCICDMLSFVYV